MNVGKRFARRIVFADGRAIVAIAEVTTGAATFSTIGCLFITIGARSPGVLLTSTGTLGGKEAGDWKPRTDEVKVNQQHRKLMKRWRCEYFIIEKK
mmetsp:Transcript_5975/g.9056  ORF Transcript_5975/g.9056 Transcript_5975/m.9056 type:complete len:96 (-) Transcript_5975:106-393(-)